MNPTNQSVEYTERVAHCSHCLRRERFQFLMEIAKDVPLYRCERCSGLGTLCQVDTCGAMTSIRRLGAVESVAESPDVTIADLEVEDFCAAHSGQLRSWFFHRAQLSSIADWKGLFSLKAEKNHKAAKRRYRAALYGGAVVLVAGSAGATAAFFYAPAALAASAGKILTAAGVSANAATKLKALWFAKGALAKGVGAWWAKGMAVAPILQVSGGTLSAGAAITTATAAVAGGAATAASGIMHGTNLVMNVYPCYKALTDFEIRPAHDLGTANLDATHVNLFISGLLSQKDKELGEWAHDGTTIGRDPAYMVRWESSTKLQALMRLGVGGLPAGAVYVGTGGRSKHLSLWKAPYNRAKDAGAVLADIIRRTPPHHTFTLYGHSLGAQVSVRCMEFLAGLGARRIRHAVLLGGAVDADDGTLWQRAGGALVDEGRIINAYSMEDDVLRYLYKVAEFKYAAGYCGVSDPAAHVVNLDCSEFVPSHRAWREKLPRVRYKARHHLHQ